MTGKGEFDVSLSLENQDAAIINNTLMKRGAYFRESDVAEARNVLCDLRHGCLKGFSVLMM